MIRATAKPLFGGLFSAIALIEIGIGLDGKDLFKVVNPLKGSRFHARGQDNVAFDPVGWRVARVSPKRPPKEAPIEAWSCVIPRILSSRI